MVLWVSKSKKWPWAASALLSAGVAHRLCQTRCNYIIFRGHVAFTSGVGEKGKMFPVSSQKNTITGTFLIFRSCSCKVNSAPLGMQRSGFLFLSMLLSVNVDLRLCFGLMFPAVVKVVYRFSMFCPHRCWRESGRHPSQPNFYIPALLEHAWSFAIQDEAELAQSMHHILLIR